MNQELIEQASQMTVTNAKSLKALFNLLFVKAGVDFTPDDDFSMIDGIEPEVAERLNLILDAAFQKFGNSVYDIYSEGITAD